MTTTINASPTNGLVQTADGSGVIKLQSNGVTTNALAWVNFNGLTTATIRASYNVSSVTRNGTGDYTVNFATALSDANYSAVTSIQLDQGGSAGTTNASLNIYKTSTALQTTTVRFYAVYNVNGGSLAQSDCTTACVAIFGN